MTKKKQEAKALILSGGGVKGTFQYGAVDHIYNHVLDEGERFKIVCGISAGAMNASIIAQNKFQLGKNLWFDQIKKGVPAFKFKYSLWTLILYGVLPGICLLCKLKKTDSLFKNKELRKILTETSKDLLRVLEETDTYLRTGIVEYQTGKYISADPTKPEYRNRVVDVIMASTTIPCIFPPVEMRKYDYFDGGVVNVTPFAEIFEITRTPEFKEKYNLSMIYSIMCSPLSTQETYQEYTDILGIAQRTLDILTKEIYVNDKEIFERTNAYVWFKQKIEEVFPDKDKLEEIYDQILKETGIDVRKYATAECKIISPDPAKWKDYMESDLWPKDLPKPKNGDSEKLFWEYWPSDLDKNKEKLIACYYFGTYMARNLLGSKR